MKLGKRTINKKGLELFVLLAGCFLLTTALVWGSKSDVVAEYVLADPTETAETKGRLFRFQHTTLSSRRPWAPVTSAMTTPCSEFSVTFHFGMPYSLILPTAHSDLHVCHTTPNRIDEEIPV